MRMLLQHAAEPAGRGGAGRPWLPSAGGHPGEQELTWTRDLRRRLPSTSRSPAMRQTEGEYDWTPEEQIRTGAQPRPPSGGPLDSGADLELNGNLPAAYEVYDRALQQSPDDEALRVAAGRLAASLLRYEDAVRWLEPAQARATQDAEIAYYLGLAYQGLGPIRDSRRSPHP